MREKNYNLELIRMISFIFVITIHVTNYYCRAWGKIPQAEYVFSLAVNVVSRMSVPCFLMISGALLLGRDEPVKKHLHRTLHFLTALIVWDAVYYLWNTYYMRSEFDLREILYVPAEAHLWYLYAMVPIYLAMPFLQILCRNMNVRTERAFMAITSGAVLFTWLLRFMGAQPYYDLPIIGDKVYVWYMFAGYYLMKYRRKFRIRQRTLVLVCVLSMAVTFGVTWGATSAMDRHCDTQLAYSTPFAILAACAFFLFVIRLGNGRLQFAERTRKIIDVFCSCSFGIYLIHPIYLDNYKKHLAAADVPAWIIVPLLTVTLAVVSFLSVWLIRRVKIGRKIT